MCCWRRVGPEGLTDRESSRPYGTKQSNSQPDNPKQNVSPFPLFGTRRGNCAPVLPAEAPTSPPCHAQKRPPSRNAAQTTSGHLLPPDFWEPQRQLPGYSNSRDPSWGNPPGSRQSSRTCCCPRAAAAARSTGAPTPLTFIRSYLSSTSCNQEMNCRALKRSLTDLFSSPYAKDSKRELHGNFFFFTLSSHRSNRPYSNPS